MLSCNRRNNSFEYNIYNSKNFLFDYFFNTISITIKYNGIAVIQKNRIINLYFVVTNQLYNDYKKLRKNQIISWAQVVNSYKILTNNYINLKYTKFCMHKL